MPATRTYENRERNGHVLVWNQNGLNEIFEENRPRGEYLFRFIIIYSVFTFTFKSLEIISFDIK